MTESKTLVVRIRENLLIAGEGLSDVRAMYMELTQQDKDDLVRAFNDEGMPTTLTKVS